MNAACIHACIHTCLHAGCIHTCTHAYVYTYIHAYKDTYRHRHTHIQCCIHIRFRVLSICLRVCAWRGCPSWAFSRDMALTCFWHCSLCGCREAWDGPGFSVDWYRFRGLACSVVRYRFGETTRFGFWLSSRHELNALWARAAFASSWRLRRLCRLRLGSLHYLCVLHPEPEILYLSKLRGVGFKVYGLPPRSPQAKP